MPEKPDPKIRPQIRLAVDPHEGDAAPGHEAPAYAELQVTSNFSFLRGGSHPEELLARARELGLHAIAVTDRNTLAGIVRAHVAGKEVKQKFVVGCRVEVAWEWALEGEGSRKAIRQSGNKAIRGEGAGIPSGGGGPAPAPLNASVPYCLNASNDALPPRGTIHLLLYPTDRASYGRLCRLLTLGKRRAEKGECRITWRDVIAHQEGMLAILVLPEGPLDARWWARVLHDLREVFDDDRLSLAITQLYEANRRRRFEELILLSQELDVPLVATNDVHYHVPRRRALQDVLTCVRLGCTIHEAGEALLANSERHMKSPAEMARLFEQVPEALARTVEIADRAGAFSLDDLKYEYPREVCPEGKTLMGYLRELTWKGAREKYGIDVNHRGTEQHRGAQRTKETEHKKEETGEEIDTLGASLCLCGKSIYEPCACVPEDVRARLEHEFSLIEALNYPAYFLTVYDIVKFARSRGILCQGRGAAANSAVCYCLGITSVDPAKIDLLVERFISKERDEPPDIDIDFEHERREEVIQYIYKRFGRERAALTAEVISYRRRSAVREVGKAMGLSLDCVDRLAKSHDWWEKEIIGEGELRAMGLDPRDRTIRRVAKLAKELLGFPRHLSQHVGGFVITEGPLCESVPIENAAMEERTVIEWDKDDIDAMGMLKIDVLGLGMMTAISKAMTLVNDWGRRRYVEERLRREPQRHRDPQRGTEGEDGNWEVVIGNCLPAVREPQLPITDYQLPSPGLLELHTLPHEDPAVYEMLCHADSVGVFQVESRAQMAMLPRLRPRCYYDLVIEVAIVRPGPIQGGMVHPYLRRRCGEEEVKYPSEAVRGVLERTLGVPLFQEQVMRLAMVAAGFSGGEADQLRRAMAAWKRKGHLIEKYIQKIIVGMIERGYTKAYALRVCEQIRGFGEYGFPESHAASFAHLVYASAWLKKYHPAAFCAALINSQPMGFYQPAQLVRDARDHGVQVLPVDVNVSGWDCSLEGTEAQSHTGTKGADALSSPPSLCASAPPALRLGMRLVRGLKQGEAERVVEAVARRGRFGSILALWRASGVRISTLKKLAGADAFGSMGLDRQRAMWEIAKLRDGELPLLEEWERGEAQRHRGTEAQRGGGGEDASAPFVPVCLSASVPSSDVLPRVPESRLVVQDYGALGMSLRAHPMAFVREKLRGRGFVECGKLREPRVTPHNWPVAVAGLVLVRQRPGTASGIIFVTLEDETGVTNLVVRPHVYERCKMALRGAVALAVWGHVERAGEVVHVIVREAVDVNELEERAEMAGRSRDFH